MVLGDQSAKFVASRPRPQTRPISRQTLLSAGIQGTAPPEQGALERGDDG
jgi:hypothetical protein